MSNYFDITNMEDMGSGTSIRDLQQQQSYDNQSSYSELAPDTISNYEQPVYNPNTYNPNVYEPQIEENINIIAESIAVPEKKKDDDISYIIQEVVLLVLLFVLLSQPYIIKFFGQFIKMILPTKDGVSLIGLIIYGFILAGSFVAIRKYTLPVY